MLKPKIKLQETLSGQIYNALQGEIVEEILKEAKTSDADNYWKNMMEGQSFKVERRLLQRLYDMFYEVKEKLNYKDDVDFYVTGDSSVNAFSVASEKEGEPHIVNVNSALVELMSDDELKFVIGHELGHLINQDTRLRRLITFVYPNPVAMPTAMLHKVRLEEQLAELVADRYGYIAAGSLEPCVSAFFKMASGLDISKMHIDLDVLLEENMKHLEYFLNDKGTSMETHPVHPIRVQSLNLFSKCKSDRALTKEMEPLIQILLKVGSSSTDYYLARFIASAGLIVASADEDISDKELELIMNNLAETQMFPMTFIEEINKSEDVVGIFNESIGKVLEDDPMMREGMFRYMIDLVMVDRRLKREEIELLYLIGENSFGYSHKEIAIMLAEMVQTHFQPSVYELN